MAATVNWRDLFPFPSHFQELRNGLKPVRMHFVTTGQSHSQTLLCVHGNPTWSFYYRRLLAELSDVAKVVAVDHVGCGLSDKPQTYSYCLNQHIQNLVEFVEQQDLQNITLVVHDWGGAIGLGAALEMPQRIKKLMILNTAAFPPPFVPWRIAACRIPVVGNWAMRGLNLFAVAALRMTLSRLPKLDAAVSAGLIAPYASWNERVGIARFVQDIPRSASDPTWKRLGDIEKSLSSLSNRPTSFVWGMHDWCFRPECLDRLQSHFPDALTTKLSDVGHYVMEEAAEEVICELRALLSR